MQHLEGSGTPVLYIGRTVLKGLSITASSFEINSEVLARIYLGASSLKYDSSK